MSLVSGPAVLISWSWSNGSNMIPNVTLYLQGGTLLLEQAVLHYGKPSCSLWSDSFCSLSPRPRHKPKSSGGSASLMSNLLSPDGSCCSCRPACCDPTVSHSTSLRSHYTQEGCTLLPYVGCAGGLSVPLRSHSAFIQKTAAGRQQNNQNQSNRTMNG